MSEASGSNLRLTYIEETVWGVTPLTPQMTILRGITSESLGGSQENIVSNELNKSRGVAAMKPGQKTVAGDISYELAVKGAVSMLARTLGNTVTTGVGPYTHVSTIGSGPKSLTIEKWFTDIGLGFVFKGMKPNGFNLAINPQGVATGSINFMGQSYLKTSTELDSTPTEQNFEFYDGIRSTVLIGGVSYDLNSLSLDGTNNIEEARVIGKDFASGSVAGRFDITGSISLALSVDKAVPLIDKAIAGIEDTLKVTFSNTVDSVDFYLPRIQFSGDPIPKAGSQGIINLELSFTALIDDVVLSPTFNKSIVLTVINDEATI